MSRIWFFLITLMLLFSALGSRDTIASLDRAMVHAVGIDKSGEGYSVTLQVFRPDSEGSDTRLDPAKANIFVISASAPTVEEAMTVCEGRLGEFLFIGHMQVIVLGRGVSFEDPGRLFSVFLKSKESYLGVKLACTDGKASELLSAELSEGAVAAQNIVSIIERHAENSMTAVCDLLGAVSSEAPVMMPVLRTVRPSPDSQQSSDSSDSGSSEELTLSAEGARVYIRGREAFDLTAEECSVPAQFDGISGRVMLEAEAKSGKAAVSVKDGQAEISAEKRGDRIAVRLEIGVTVQSSQSTDQLFDRDELIRSCEAELTGRCERFISRCRAEHADLLHIAELVRSRYPEVWLGCGGDAEAVFDLCDIEAEVRCRVN